MNGFFAFVFLVLPLAGVASLSAIVGGILYVIHRLRGGEALGLLLSIPLYTFLAIGVGLVVMVLLAQIREKILVNEQSEKFIKLNPPGIRDVPTQASPGMFRIVIINTKYDIDSLGQEFETLEAARRSADEETQSSYGYNPTGRTYYVYDDAGNLVYTASTD